MRKLAIVILLLSLGLVSLGAGASERRTLDELQSRVEKTKGGEQAKLYAEIAELLVTSADQQFNAGESVRAQATVQQVLQNATKAHDVAIQSRDKRKEVEILLRNAQRQLETMKHTLAQVDRPPVDEVEKKLANLRQELLDSMFAPKQKKEGP